MSLQADLQYYKSSFQCESFLTAYFGAHYNSSSAVASRSIRLRGGTPSAGRVEIFYDNKWGTICDDAWGINDANVVCRQLGFSSASSAPCCAAYGQGSGPTWMDNVACQGGEASLRHCAHNGWGIENCSHGEDASVVCRN